MKITGLFLFLTLWSTTVLAHHGNSEFDLSTQLRYEGTIIEAQWRNPHIFLTLATQTVDGNAITLEIEAASPNVLRVGGFDAKSLSEGEQVTAVVSPSRRFPNASAFGYEIIKADGTVVPLVSARLRRPQTSQKTESIFSTWVATADSFSRFVRGLRNWPLNDQASEIRSRFTPVASGQARCIPVASPMLMMYPVATVLEENSDHILIKSEWLGAVRTVYIDGRSHPPVEERFQQGHSIGSWEDETFVVDTSNFSDQETGGIPSGGSRHLLERFTLNQDGKRLNYDYVLQDPEFLEGEISGAAEFSYRPDLEVTKTECDLELAKRFFREFE